MRPNKIKQKWRDGKSCTMGWLSVSHSFSAEMMARQGFDCLCVDLQHGTSEMGDILPMLQAISQTETVPIVRVAWNEPAAIMKALDLGAYGIIIPLVNNGAEAAQAVAACRYPPVGIRSSGPVRAAHYGGTNYFTEANVEIIVMAMIETKEGIANLDDDMDPAAQIHQGVEGETPQDGKQAEREHVPEEEASGREEEEEDSGREAPPCTGTGPSRPSRYTFAAHALQSLVSFFVVPRTKTWKRSK